MNRNDTTRTTSTATVDYQARFEQLQTRFIDEPREAVREASTLVREAVDRLFEHDDDTEQLRRVMQGYRDLLARLDGRESLSEPAARSAAVAPEGREMRTRGDVGEVPETDTDS
jgi:chromatin segregation and condensation protein Rec8/ScpA/Scc1 (kleisin family)